MSCGAFDQIDWCFAEEVGALVDADLPTYSILVPPYKDLTVLPILAAALKRLITPEVQARYKVGP